MSPQVWAMIEPQRYTGMRPGEVTSMRTADIDTSGKVWVYSPTSHTTAWRGHRRKIYLGPRAQAVLKEWLRTDLDGYLFQPCYPMAHVEAVVLGVGSHARSRSRRLLPRDERIP